MIKKILKDAAKYFLSAVGGVAVAVGFVVVCNFCYEITPIFGVLFFIAGFCIFGAWLHNIDGYVD